MHRNLVILPFVLLLVSACASNPEVRLYQTQVSYNELADLAIEYRAPCIDVANIPSAGPDHPDCKLDDTAWPWVKRTLDSADNLLKRAWADVLVGETAAVENWVDRVLDELAKLAVFGLEE